MDDDRQKRTHDRIVRVVLDLLEAEGYDGLKLRSVATRARVSLKTIYKLFPNRDELIVAALVQWMDENTYSQLDDPAPEALTDWLMWQYRKILEPFQRSPGLLEAYHHAQQGPLGRQLTLHGIERVTSVAWRRLGHLDPTYAQDLAIVFEHLVTSLIGRLAMGELTIADALVVLERALYRMTHDNEELARGARSQPS